MQIGSFANFNFGLRALSDNQSLVAQSLERLATGKKINRAADDPSGIIAAEEHKVRIYSINAELKALAQQEGFLGAKEGGLSVINEQFEQLNGLVVAAANLAGNSQEEQDAIKLAINSVLGSINRIASTTTYKGQQILSEYTLAALGNNPNAPQFNIDPNADPDAEDQTPKTLANLAELAFEDPETAQKLAQGATNRIATARAGIGINIKEIDSKRSVLSEELINLSESLSSIEDTDFAAEASKLVRAQILEQASIAAISINRQSAQQVLGLIQGAADMGKQIAARG